MPGRSLSPLIRLHRICSSSRPLRSSLQMFPWRLLRLLRAHLVVPPRRGLRQSQLRLLRLHQIQRVSRRLLRGHLLGCPFLRRQLLHPLQGPRNLRHLRRRFPKLWLSCKMASPHPRSHVQKVQQTAAWRVLRCLLCLLFLPTLTLAFLLRADVTLRSESFLATKLIGMMLTSSVLAQSGKGSTFIACFVGSGWTTLTTLRADITRGV